MSIQGLRITEDQIRYVFPKKINNIKQFLQIGNLKQNLKQQFNQFADILPNFPYRSKYPSNGMGITLQCSFCPNKLVYEINKKKGKFELKTFCLDHVHGKNFDKQQVRKQYPIKSYPIYTQNIQKLIKQKIQSLQEPLSSHLDNKEEPKMKEPHNFQELLASLKQKNYYVAYEPENLKEQKLIYPDFLFITSPQMKKMYMAYGRSIGFDFTFSLIRETPMTIYGRRQYIIGLIAGLNQYRRIGIFALVVANQESTHYVERAFTQFINYMNRQPESIVTDQAPGMLSAMKNIKQKGVYNGETYWDTFHVLKTYRFRNKALKSHMRAMIREKCKYQFHKMYLQAVRMARTQQEMDAIHKFMHESSKYCISQIPTSFIGLGVSDSQNEMVNNLIKNQIPMEAKYIKVVYKILLFIDQRNLMAQTMARQTCRVDEIVNSRQLHIVRYSLCRTVYSFFFLQLCKCCKVDIIYRDTDNNDFYCIQDANTVHYITKLPIQECPSLIKKSRATHIRDVYKCTCQFLQKTGIPCQHILKIIFQTDRNFIDRLDQYWVIDEPDKLFKCISNLGDQFQKKVKKRGRPLGKPTLFYKPTQEAEMKLPKGVSTFEPIKPRGLNQAYPQNNIQMSLGVKVLEEQQKHEKNPSLEKQINNKKQMMIQYFLEKSKR